MADLEDLAKQFYYVYGYAPNGYEYLNELLKQ